MNPSDVNPRYANLTTIPVGEHLHHGVVPHLNLLWLDESLPLLNSTCISILMNWSIRIILNLRHQRLLRVDILLKGLFQTQHLLNAWRKANKLLPLGCDR